MLSGNFTVRIFDPAGVEVSSMSVDNRIDSTAVREGLRHLLQGDAYTDGHTWYVGFINAISNDLTYPFSMGDFSEISTTVVPRLLFYPNAPSGGGITGSSTTYLVSIAPAPGFFRISGFFLTNSSTDYTNGFLWSAAPADSNTVVATHNYTLQVDYTVASSTSSFLT